MSKISQQFLIKVKLARFQRAIKKLPVMKIPEKYLIAAEKKGYKFN
jgi:hypothetical protein